MTTAPIAIDPKAVYLMGDQPFTGEQIAAALEACVLLERAYALSDPDNGGAGSVSWSAVDEARVDAQRALGDSVSEVTAWVRMQNGHQDGEHMTEEESNAELESLLAGAPWSLTNYRSAQPETQTPGG